MYKIQKNSDSKPIIVHVDHLKPYLGENIPESWQKDDITNNSAPTEDENEKGDLSDQFKDNYNGDYFDRELSDSDEMECEIPDKPELKTPPRLTRCGRQVRKPLKYSPKLLNEIKLQKFSKSCFVNMYI